MSHPCKNKTQENVTKSDPNLDSLCIYQLYTALFCEYYAKLYFYGKRLKRYWVGGEEIFGALCGQYLSLRQFSRLCSENITREMFALLHH